MIACVDRRGVDRLQLANGPFLNAWNAFILIIYSLPILEHSPALEKSKQGGFWPSKRKAGKAARRGGSSQK